MGGEFFLQGGGGGLAMNYPLGFWIITFKRRGEHENVMFCSQERPLTN